MAYVFDAEPDYKEACDLVLAFHYSRRKPPGVRKVCGLRVDGQLVAACFFSNPPTRWSEPVLELSRLVRHPEYRPQLSGLISKTVKEVKKAGIADLLVSFADNTQGHSGGVYQTSSWNFHGLRAPSHDGFMMDDGSFIPRRTAYAMAGTSSRTSFPELMATAGRKAVPHFDTGKYLYWKAVGKEGSKKAERLGLKRESYPKPLVD